MNGKPFKHHQLLVPAINGDESRLSFPTAEARRAAMTEIAAYYGGELQVEFSGLASFAILHKTKNSKTGELVLVMKEFTYSANINGKVVPSEFAVKFSRPASHREIAEVSEKFNLGAKKFVPASLR